MIAILSGTLILLVLGALFVHKARDKNLDIITRAAITRRRETASGKRHVFFCFVDHYEPFWQGADRGTAIERVKVWQDRYPKITDPWRDSSGRPPQHTFFYPEEEYDPECLDRIAELCRGGHGDVEVHLHHNNDTSEGFRNKLTTFTRKLHDQHGLLRAHDDRIAYAFIHGNWALDNSRPDGLWCGVNDELRILRDTGCYADFTFPSAPDPTQPPKINQIYYATDDPARPCSHHRGEEVSFGRGARGDLLMVTGPLTVNWNAGRVMPAIENGDVADHCPPTPHRVDLWVRQGIAVRGYPNWVFVKVHTHGAQEDNAAMLLSERGTVTYRSLLEGYNDGERYVTHFVTAREMYLCVDALASGNQDIIRRIEGFEYPDGAVSGGK